MQRKTDTLKTTKRERRDRKATSRSPQPPGEIWVSWCATCGKTICADVYKAQTSCPTCPFPSGRVRFARYTRKPGA